MDGERAEVAAGKEAGSDDVAVGRAGEPLARRRQHGGVLAAGEFVVGEVAPKERLDEPVHGAPTGTVGEFDAVVGAVDGASAHAARWRRYAQ